jgi:hypothetical protein
MPGPREMQIPFASLYHNVSQTSGIIVRIITEWVGAGTMYSQRSGDRTRCIDPDGGVFP